MVTIIHHKYSFPDVDWVGKGQSANSAPFCQAACTEHAKVHSNAVANPAGLGSSVKHVGQSALSADLSSLGKREFISTIPSIALYQFCFLFAQRSARKVAAENTAAVVARARVGVA